MIEIVNKMGGDGECRETDKRETGEREKKREEKDRGKG